MNIFKFPYTVDVSRLNKELDNNHVCWSFDKSRKSIYEQRHTETIPLRSGKMRMGVRLWDSHEVYDTVLKPYFPEAFAFIEHFTSRYKGDCGRIAIVKLPKSLYVTTHIDYGDYYRKRERIHLVLRGIYEYQVGEEKEIFQEGDLFWFDSQKPHSAHNIGTEDRVTMIFDVQNSNFLDHYGVKKDV